MLAGGTGITPCLQVLHHLLAAPLEERTDVCFVSANSTLDDVLLFDELHAMAARCPQLKLVFFISRGPVKDGFVAGRLSAEALRPHVSPAGPRHRALICGPDGFNACAAEALQGLGFDPTVVYKF